MNREILFRGKRVDNGELPVEYEADGYDENGGLQMRLIDADALVAIFSERGRKYWTEHSYVKAREAGAAQTLVREAPTIEAEPVRHGRWVYDYDGDYEKCTCCGIPDALSRNDYEYRGGKIRDNNSFYCPNCGAKMDGGD